MFNTCSTSRRGSWQMIPRMGRKKVDRWRHRAELVNIKVLPLFFWCFCPALVNDCTMHDAFIWRAAIKQGNCSCVCGICFILSSLEADLPWLTNCSLQGGARLKRQNQYLEVVGSSSSVPLEETVSMLVWIARALKPIAARGLAHWRRSRCIDGFLGHQMTNESKSVKCSPGPLSQPIHLTLQPHWWRKASLASSDRTQVQT